MGIDTFTKALENPEEKPAGIEDNVDVGEISSDEEVESGTHSVQATCPAEGSEEPFRKTSTDLDEVREVNQPLESEGLPLLNAGEGSSSSEDEDSDDSSSSSSKEEGPLMDEVDDEDEEGDTVHGPIKSKNELNEEPIFEIPNDFELGPDTPIREIGFIKSAFDYNIIVQSVSSAEQRVLKENSLLCLEDRQILGPLCEVFGPLQSPFYRVLLPKSKNEQFEILQNKAGAKVFYVAPEAHWLDTFELKRMRGTDASNGFDEELPEDEQEFSDDEKEAEFKKLKKNVKKRKHEVATNAGSNLSKRSTNNAHSKLKPRQAAATGFEYSSSSSSYKPRNERQHEASRAASVIAQPQNSHTQQQHMPTPQPPYASQQGFGYPQQVYASHQMYSLPPQQAVPQYGHPFPQTYHSQYPQMLPPQHLMHHPQHIPQHPPAQFPGTYSYTQGQPPPQQPVASQPQNMDQVLQLQQILMNQQRQNQNQPQ
ncbi:LAQU0S05e02586g1_1 [Lachancea quebecensis]|uniref:H/ACA ribonucleoprotein complex non-core subunit NAF1 n=1 Tax=Lachancea quebecensis TaxID=1654605 RepID=A0A0P1KQU3_9SACH|nr:LAQU0S05e02586g1_1 [Lachancea quebecensis]